MAGDEDLLTCDFAQYYHIINWREIPLSKAVSLAFGLPDDSRSKRKLSGHNYTTDQLLMCHLIDRLSLLVWFQTKDGHENRNRPKSFVEAILPQEEEQSDEIMTFSSGEELKKYIESLQNKG